MTIIAVGINHKNTPIEIREQLFLNPTQQDLLLSELKSNPAIMEACVLSTCNRVEIYVQVLDKEIDVNTFIKLIFQIKKVPFTEELIKQSEQLILDFDLIDSRNTNLAGIPANSIIYTGIEGQNNLKWLYIIAIKENKLYILVFIAEVDKYNDYIGTFQEMIDSFETV